MISNLASIHPKAKIAENVTIEPFTTIAANVEIAEGTWIGPNATIMDGARIGKNVRIFPGAVVSAIPQDLKYKGEDTITEIGDGSVIRECVTVNKGTVDQHRTSIGKNCLLMAYAHIAHDCILGNNIIIANSVNLAGHVNIQDYAIIEGMAAVGQFLTIGAHSFIAGGTLVRKNVPPYCKAAREPISYVGINSVGLRRRGFTEDEIRLIEDIYRIIYVKGLSISNAIKAVENEIPDHAIKNGILAFIHNSPNGIMKGYSRD
jgi:UDP-N-acetylglucosamine acyltransferase